MDGDKWIEDAKGRYNAAYDVLNDMRPLIAACVEQHLDNCMTVHFPGGGSAKRGGCEICAALRELGVSR